MRHAPHCRMPSENSRSAMGAELMWGVPTVLMALHQYCLTSGRPGGGGAEEHEYAAHSSHMRHELQ